MPSLLVTPPAHLPRQPRCRASIQQPRKTDAGQCYVGKYCNGLRHTFSQSPAAIKMKFIISEKHKRKRKRGTLLAATTVIILLAAFSVMLVSSEDLSDKIIATTGIFFLAKYLPGTYRSIKNHDTAYPEIEISEQQGKIQISHKDAVVSIPLADIESLTIQSIRGNIKSLLLTTTPFSDLRLEGYENLREMAELLKKYTPSGRIKHARWYHR